MKKGMIFSLCIMFLFSTISANFASVSCSSQSIKATDTPYYPDDNSDGSGPYTDPDTTDNSGPDSTDSGDSWDNGSGNDSGPDGDGGVLF